MSLLNHPHKVAHTNLQRVVFAIEQLKQLEAENEAKVKELAGELAAIPNYVALLSAAELDKLTGITDADESAQRIAALKAEQANTIKKKQQIDADLAKCRSMLSDIRGRMADHESQIPELREQARATMRAHIRNLIDREAKKLGKLLPALEASYIEIQSLAKVMWTVGGDCGVRREAESAIALPWSDDYGFQDEYGRVFWGANCEGSIQEKGDILEAALRQNFPETFARP